MARLSIAAALVAPFALVGTSALAQDDDALRPRFEIAAGAFFSTSDSNVRLSSSVLGIGTQISLERDLGFDRNDTSARAEALWRFGSERRHRFEASYFGLSRQSRKIIDRTIQYGDRVFPVAADIEGELDLDIFKLGYTYMLYSSDQAEIGASAGLFGIDQRASLREVSRDIFERSDVTFPLPTVGVRAEMKLWTRIALKASGDVFFIDTGDFDGDLYDLIAAVEVDAIDRLSVGLGFNYADLDVTEHRRRGNLDVEVSYKGPLAYLRLKL